MMFNESVHTIARFAFESGAVLENMKVGYCTHGTLNGLKNNMVLVTHGTSANRHTFDCYIGPGKAFDTTKYFVVCVDAIGGGTSSAPSDGLGMDFPRYTIRDMVRAQHDLVVNGLKVPSLLAVGGSSMGAFQALEWGIHFPQFAKGLLLLVPSAKSAVNFKAVVDTMIEVVKLDPAWNGGRYVTNPVNGLRTAGLVFGTWFLSDIYLETRKTEAEYQQAFNVMANIYAQWDAVDWMWRYLASRDHDVSRSFGGDLARALAAVEATALVMPSSTDRVLPPFGADPLSKGIKKVRYHEITSILGHMAQNPPETSSPEHQFVNATISSFLSELNFS